MPFDDFAQRRQQRGHILAAHPMTATRIEHVFQFFDHERHVAAAPKHRRDHAAQGHGPRIVIHIFGVDEHLERTLAAIVVQKIVQRDVQGVLGFRPIEFVGVAFEGFRTLQGLEHLMHGGTHFGLRLGRALSGGLVERQGGLFGFLGFRLALDLQHRPGDVVGTVRGAALQP